jgi:hypothetical protein
VPESIEHRRKSLKKHLFLALIFGMYPFFFNSDFFRNSRRGEDAWHTHTSSIHDWNTIWNSFSGSVDAIRTYFVSKEYNTNFK